MKYVLERIHLRYNCSRYYFFDTAEAAKEKAEEFDNDVKTSFLNSGLWVTDGVKEVTDEKAEQMKSEMEQVTNFWAERIDLAKTL